MPSDQNTGPQERRWRDVKEPEWRAVLASTAALARSDSEDQLLREVCVAAVEAGGYLLAWYGRLVSNGEFHVHSVASAGPSHYLDDFVVGWAHDVTTPTRAGWPWTPAGRSSPAIFRPIQPSRPGETGPSTTASARSSPSLSSFPENWMVC